MVHIDFAFMLGWAPGGITFERAAFVLTKEVVDVWGGRGSPLWDEFVELVASGMHAVQLHHELIMRDVEVTIGSGARFPFLTGQTKLSSSIPRRYILKGLRRSAALRPAL